MPAPVSTGVMSTPNSFRTISTARPLMAMVETLLTSDPSVRARLPRSSASRVVPLLTSCSKRRTRRRRGADQRVGEQADQQHLEAVAERPLGERPERHARARPHAGELERREEEQRGAQHECGEADEAQRTADERARRREVIADDGHERAARQASGDERHQPGDEEASARPRTESSAGSRSLRRGLGSWLQDNRCAGNRITGGRRSLRATSR